MTVKFISVPTKRLAETISGSEYAFELNNIQGWDGSNLEAADFGTKHYIAFRNAAGTKLELMEIDPSTIASAQITILKRGLGFDGDQVTEVPANIQDVWVKGDTLVELGTHASQLLEETVRKSGDQTIAGVKTFSEIPKSAGTATDTDHLVNYSTALSLLTGSASVNRIQVSGTAGENLTVGNLVYLKESDGKWWKCDADTAASVENIILGIAQATTTANVSISGGVLLQGLDTNQTGLSTNTVYYASNTAGAISSTPGTSEVTLGISRSTTSILFVPRYNQQLTEDQQDALAGSSSSTTPSATNKFLVNSTIPAGIIMPYAGASAPTDWVLCDGSAISRSTYATLFAIVGTTYGTGDGSTTFNVPDFRGRVAIGSGAGTKVATFVSQAGNTITATGLSNISINEFQTGTPVTYHTSGTVITGLTNDTVYYVIKVTNSTFKLASSLSNANAGTAIALSSNGSGTQTFTYSITTTSLGDTGGEQNHLLSVAELAAHTHTYGNGGAFGYTGGGQSGSSATNTSSAGGDSQHNNMQPFLAINYIIKTI